MSLAPRAAIVPHFDGTRLPVIADEPCVSTGVPTDIQEDAHSVELVLTIRKATGETSMFGTPQVFIPG